MKRRSLLALGALTISLVGLALLAGQQSQADALLVATATNNSVSLMTDRQLYAPGQPVVITLRNHGRTAIALPRDPAFHIKQGDQVVYEPVAALGTSQTAARALSSNEAISWQWDQFTLSGQASSGAYHIVVQYQVNDRTESITTTITVVGA